MTRIGRAIRDGVGWITLNDPTRRNALDLDLAAELTSAIQELDGTDGVHALVVTGTGSVFCAGADLRTLARADEQSFRAIYLPFLALAACTTPTVAAVNGPAVGAGFNLALACDLRIAAQSAHFESRFLQIPIHPGGGHTWKLNRLVGPQAAAALCVFGQPLNGAMAARIGLVWSCVPDTELMSACANLCSTIATSPTPHLARQIKSTLRDAQTTPSFEESLQTELTRQVASTLAPEFRQRMDAVADRAGRSVQ